MNVTHKTRFDTRVVDFHLRKGSVSHDEYTKYLGDLPDDAAESEASKTAFVPSYEIRNAAQQDEATVDPSALG